MDNHPILQLVGGHPGTGKSQRAQELARSAGWTLLDKDVLTNALAEKLNELFCGGRYNYEKPAYDMLVRPATYQVLYAAVLDNLRLGHSVVAVAPLTQELVVDSPANKTFRQFLADCVELGVQTKLEWLTADAKTLKTNIMSRSAPRDAWKMANWEKWVSSFDCSWVPELGEHLPQAAAQSSLG